MTGKHHALQRYLGKDVCLTTAEGDGQAFPGLPRLSEARSRLGGIELT
jgi:hypothetical protein